MRGTALHNHTHSASMMSSVGETAKAIGQLARDICGDPDLASTGRCILEHLSRRACVPQGSLWLSDQDQACYRRLTYLALDASSQRECVLAADHPLPTILGRRRRFAHLADEEACEALRLVDAAVGLPFMSRNQLLGFCTLGPASAPARWDEATAAVMEALADVACNALEHQRREEELRRSSALLRRTDRLRSLEIMAGGFAHEIRNPLTSIKTFVQLAPQRQHDPVFIPEFSRVAIEDVHEIERLLHDILDYARYMSPHPTEEDLNEVVASCMCFVSAKASSRGIQLRTELDPALPPLSLDRQQIKQVLMNLLLNALDATPDSGGEICVRTRVTARPDGSSRVELRVEDHGRGIPPDQLEHIFDPFFTTKHSNSESEGSGLGLTIAHQIVREHHGELCVESHVGTGSTFTVYLPAIGKHTTASAPRE